MRAERTQAKNSMRSRRQPEKRAAENASLWHKAEALNFIADMVLLLAITLLTYALVSWVINKPYFLITELRINNRGGHIAQEDIHYAGENSVKGSFFTVDLDAVRDAFESVTWVESARIQRIWPGTVVVDLDEYQPIANWQSAGEKTVQLLSNTGVVFGGEMLVDLPTLSGPLGSEVTVLNRFVEMQKILQGKELSIKSLSLSTRGAWTASLSDGITLVLGRDQKSPSLEDRLQNFVETYAKLSEQLGQPIVTADLRYPNGYAIQVKSN